MPAVRIIQHLPAESVPGGESQQIIPGPFETGGLLPPVVPPTPFPPSIAGHIIQDESVDLPQQPRLNFIGGGVTAADNPVTKVTDVTIPAANYGGTIWGTCESGVAGNPASAGLSAIVRMGFAGTIISATMIATTLNGAAQATSAVMDVWKKAGAIPTVADTITSADKPTLTAASYSEDTTLSWSTLAFAVGDVFIFRLDSNNTAESVHCSLKVTKS